MWFVTILLFPTPVSHQESHSAWESLVFIVSSSFAIVMAKDSEYYFFLETESHVVRSGHQLTI